MFGAGGTRVGSVRCGPEGESIVSAHQKKGA